MVPLRAPTDCVQYFTGISDTVQNYNFGQQLQGQYYENCVRTAEGYCRIQWQQNSATTPDTFQIDTQAAAAGAASGPAVGGTSATACPALGYVIIPDASSNGYSPLPAPAATAHGWQNTFCGGVLGKTPV